MLTFEATAVPSLPVEKVKKNTNVKLMYSITYLPIKRDPLAPGWSAILDCVYFLVCWDLLTYRFPSAYAIN